MRHQTLAGRYTMPSQVTLGQALTALPVVVPISVDERFLGGMNPKSLDNGGDVADTQNATLNGQSGTRKKPIEQPRRTKPDPKVSQPDGTSGAPGRSFTAGQLPKRAKESSPQIVPRMPKCAFQGRVDSIAAMLEATARLLRSLDRDNQQQTED